MDSGCFLLYRFKYIPATTTSPDQAYLKYWIQKDVSKEGNTYWIVNGLLKNIKDIIIVTAFLQVVTVTAAKAPQVLTKVKTICIPKYPVKEKIIA